MYGVKIWNSLMTFFCISLASVVVDILQCTTLKLQLSVSRI